MKCSITLYHAVSDMCITMHAQVPMDSLVWTVEMVGKEMMEVLVLPDLKGTLVLQVLPDLKELRVTQVLQD